MITLPFFQIVSDVESTFDTEAYPEPPTADRKFNRWYKLINTDPHLVDRTVLRRLLRDPATPGMWMVGLVPASCRRIARVSSAAESAS